MRSELCPAAAHPEVNAFKSACPYSNHFQACEWFKLAHAGIEAAAHADGSDEDAYLTLTADALHTGFEQTSGGKELELSSMGLK